MSLLAQLEENLKAETCGGCEVDEIWCLLEGSGVELGEANRVDNREFGIVGEGIAF